MNLQPRSLQDPAQPIELLELIFKKRQFPLNSILNYLLLSNNAEFRLELETSGLDPEITICKIVVLPVKLCPLIKNKLITNTYRHIFKKRQFSLNLYKIV